LIIVVHATESVSVTRIKSKGKRNNYTNTSKLLASVFMPQNQFQLPESKAKAKETITLTLAHY
jgi:hypothetical protein